MSAFEMNNLEGVIFWNAFFVCIFFVCIVLKQNASDFEFEIFWNVGFHKSLHTKNHASFFYSTNTRFFAFFLLFLNQWLGNKIFYTSDFKLKKVHRLGFWNRKSNGNASDFDLKVYIGSDFELMEKENASVFKLNFLQCVSFRLDLFCVARFWNKKDGTC